MPRLPSACCASLGMMSLPALTPLLEQPQLLLSSVRASIHPFLSTIWVTAEPTLPHPHLSASYHPAPTEGTPHLTPTPQPPKFPSSLALNTSRGRAFTTSLGSYDSVWPHGPILHRVRRSPCTSAALMGASWHC